MAVAHPSHGDDDVDIERAKERVEAWGEPIGLELALIEKMQVKVTGVGFIV